MNQFKIIQAQQLATMLQRESLHLVDVRSEAEIAQGKIPQGESMPLHLIPERLHTLDKSKTTVFYCRVGARSAQAAEFAVAQGFSDVYNLQGGILAWVQAGLPVTTPA